MSTNKKIVDSRGYTSLCTIAQLENGKFCYVCCSCDGEFISAKPCLEHVMSSHAVKAPKIEPRIDDEVVDLISSGSEDENFQPNEIGKSSTLMTVQESESSNKEPSAESAIETTEDTNENAKKCAKCSMPIGDDSIEMSSHAMTDCQNSNTEPITCSYCPKKFQLNIAKNRHMREHHSTQCTDSDANYTDENF